MGSDLAKELAVPLDELARAARELAELRASLHGPLDADDPLDESIARLLRYVEQLEGAVR